MFSLKPTWTDERVELLRRHFQAGLSCSEIAREIGVSRNAVIGKIFRLHLSRPKRVTERRPERETGPTARRPRAFGQHRILMVLRAKAQPAADEVPIHKGHCCSLLELSKEKCHWPISNPGVVEFQFCGNKSVDGLPYCEGHARIAYQPAPRHRVALP